MKGLYVRVLLEVFLLIYLSGPGAADSCPLGWASGNNVCYLVRTDPSDHSTAVTQCSMYNATLVSIPSDEEWDGLLSLLETGDSARYWLGLQRTDSGLYIWADGQAYTKSAIHWAGDTEGHGYQKGSSDCAVLNVTAGAGGYVRYGACSDHLPVVCERPSNLDYVALCDVDDGWQDVAGTCYKTFTSSMTWSDAQAECLRQNSQLFLPTSVSDSSLSLLKDLGQAEEFWTGLSAKSPTDAQRLVTSTQGHGALSIPGSSCMMASVAPAGGVSFQTTNCSREVGFVCQRAVGQCPQGWDEHNGRCYQFQTVESEYTTWFFAKQFCRDEGSEVLILNSMDEHNFVTQKLLQDGVSDVWLGFSDEAVADTLQWVDGTPATGGGAFGVWTPAFPHPEPGRLDCGILQVGNGNGTWSNGYCFNARGFICEIPFSQSLRPKAADSANYSCDAGWLLYGNQCFFFDSDDTSWDLAKQSCQGVGAHLATVSDVSIQSFLALNVETVSWLGLRLDRHDMGYYWTDATPENFTNYFSGEPNGAAQGMDCIEMFVGSKDFIGAWIDQNCSKARDYICQKPAVQTTSQVGATVSTSPWSGRCGLNWILNPYNDVCYLMVVDAPKTWSAASYDCLRRDANLLSVSGPDEQTRVNAILSYRYAAYQDPFWIGASDSTQEGGWEWSDHSPFRYFNWHAGEPSDQSSTENCAEMRVQWDNQWSDRSCDDHLNYICKKQAKTSDVIPSEPTPPSFSSCSVQPMISGQYSVQSELSFSASSRSDDQHTAHDSRLLDNNKRAWRPAKDQTGEWVGVFFYQTMWIGGIDTAGETNTFNFVSSFTVQYQYDVNSPWRWVENPPGTPQVFYASEFEDTSVTTSILLVEPIQAQSVRIYPQSWGTHIAVRWELNGCVYDACQPDFAISGPLVVMDDGLSASSLSDFDHNAFAARLHPIHPDTPLSCWRPADQGDALSPPWIQADLGTVKLLRGVVIAGNPNADEWVTSFQLQFHLNDGSDNFTVYQEPYGIPMNFTGNTDNHTVVTYFLKTSIPVQRVRIVPVAAHNHIALRFDLLVCNIGCKDIALISGQRNVSSSALTASSSLDPQHSPHRSRLGEQFVGASGGAWAARFNDIHQYIQVDLGEGIEITGVATQGSEDLGMWVRSYTLAFSQDGQDYSTYTGNGQLPRIFDGNFDATSVRKHYLDRPQVARYVQLWPVDYNAGIALRWELYGCPGPNSGQAVGCFQDNPESRDLPYEALLDPLAEIWPASCRAHCYEKGYYYAGLQNVTACYCGDSYGKYAYTGDACTLRCLNPYDDQICGGVVNNFIYQTGLLLFFFRGDLAPMFKFCKTGWTPRGDSCYIVMLETASWYDARQVCQQIGGDLVAIDSKVENDFVFSLLAASGVTSSAWIGLNDLQTSKFYQWADNSDVTFTAWDAGQPVADPVVQQHCVALNRQTGGWMTTMCKNTLFSVCAMAQTPSAVPHLPPVMDFCDTGWSGFEGSCYTVVTQSGTWNNSRQACLAFNASLIRIDDQYEQAFIASQLATFSGYFWTDATDSVTPGQYAFFDNLGYVRVTKWGHGQPQGGNGHCVAVRGGQYDGVWYNRNCTSSLDGAVCERPLPGYVAPPTPPIIPSGARCPEKWYEAIYSCFQINILSEKTRLTWHEAREDCESQGAELASFHSPVDFDNLIKNLPPDSPDNLWIGLYYDDMDEALKWSDGSSANFMKWKSGQPTGVPGVQSCVQLDVQTGTMVQQYCYNLHNWICGIPRGSVPSPRTTVTIPSPASPGSCHPMDDSWWMFGGSCYYADPGAGDNARTWREARIWCQSKRADLVSITSQAEQLFVQGLIADIAAHSLWIGLTQLDLGHGLMWSDGSPAAFDNWDAGEPNSFEGSELCVDIFPRNGRWNDENCARKMGFICEDNLGLYHTPENPTGGLSGYCPTGFRNIGLKCYRVIGHREGEQPRDWAGARDYCKSLGPDFTMGTVGSQAENEFLVTLLPQDGVAAWIGMWRVTSGTFVWEDNSGVTYTNWNVDEPNGGMDSCVYMGGTSQEAGLWSDAPCSLKANYICETDIDGAISTPEPIPNPCDAQQGFEPFQSGCYKYVQQPMTWANATRSCQAIAASLPVIGDAYTQAFLHLFVSRKSEHFAQTGFATWLGLSDVNQTGKYKWMIPWPVSFTHWAPGEPSTGPGQGCVSMDRNGLWTDDNCSTSLPFVCVVISASPPFTPKPPKGQCVGTRDWLAFDPFCFLLRPDDLVTFYDARLRCEAVGAKLVSIHDNSSLDFLGQMFLEHKNVWIGLFSSDTEGFMWLDRTAVDFTNWAVSQPSGTGTEGVPEHCVAMDIQTRTWDDRDCTLRLGFICSKLQEVDDSVLIRPPVPATTTGLTPPTMIQRIPTLPTNRRSTLSHQTQHVTASNHSNKPVTPPGPTTTTTRRGPTESTSVPTHKPPGQQSHKGTKHALSGGAIAGMVAGVLVVAALCVVGVVLYMRKRPHGCPPFLSVREFRGINSELQDYQQFENAGFSQPELLEKDPYEMSSDT